jgi:WD40 repeat protein
MYAVAFNGDGSQVLFIGCKAATSDACTQGRIDLLNTNNATLLGTVESHQFAAAQLVAYNPDGTRFITASTSTEIILRNAATGLDLATYNAGVNITSIAFTPDGTQIVVGMENGQVRFFDATVD